MASDEVVCSAVSHSMSRSHLRSGPSIVDRIANGFLGPQVLSVLFANGYDRARPSTVIIPRVA